MAHSELDSTRQLGGFDLIVDLETRTITYETVKSEENLKAIDAYRLSLGLEKARDASKKDIDALFFYNIDFFPFEGLICKFNEIGYTKKKQAAIEHNSNEFDLMALSVIRAHSEIRESFYQNSGFSLESQLAKSPIIIENKWKLLKEFRISKSIVDVLIVPLNK